MPFNKQMLTKNWFPDNTKFIEREKPDRIVHNAKAMYPVIWGISHQNKTTLVSPVPYLHYVKGNTHVAFNSDFGPFLNKFTFSLANFGLVKTIMTSAKWLNIKKKISKEQIKYALQNNKVIYTISPSLFPRPEYWKQNFKVLGHHERNKPPSWQPDNELKQFLKKHERILFITFGSMTNPEPRKKTDIIVDILVRNKIPAIINTASGGLVKPEDYKPELLHFVSRIPYDWIFPKIYGVIHHGGSGTTHLGLKYGCAMMIIPHIIDQFVWNKIIHKKRLGPKGIKISKLNIKNLEPKIIELLNEHSFKKNAELIAKQMAEEDFKEQVYHTIIEETSHK